MRRADAPPPGWYPDPTGGSGLWWWDGLDWTEHRRPPPSSLEERDRLDPVATPSPSAAGSGTSTPTAQQLRDRSATATRAARASEQQLEAAVAEARRVARREVERAVDEATRQFDRARARWLPRVDEYLGRARRWVRVLIVLVFLAVLASAWLNATAQVGLLEWLGQRIDAAFAASVPVGLVGRGVRWPGSPDEPGSRPADAPSGPVAPSRSPAERSPVDRSIAGSGDRPSHVGASEGRIHRRDR